MKIHTISDDAFFSLGCKTILKTSGHRLNSMTPNNESFHVDLYKEIKNGDIVIVAINSHQQTVDALDILSNIGAEVMLFIDLPKKDYALMSWMNVFFSKKIEARLLVPYVENLTIFSGGGIQPLSEREKEIMEMLMNGSSIESISGFLNITMKTVYVHRANSLKKIGLNHARSFFFIKYQNYLANRSVKLSKY
jgi:DNA-binding CsgD family transcriptional regulator